MARATTNILIGGEAGQGLVTVGQLLAKTLVRAGYHISVCQDYMSRIRGGHNTFAIRVGHHGPLGAPQDGVDLLVALNDETVSLHKGQLLEGGLCILGKDLDPQGLAGVAVPFDELSPKPIFENVAALGVLCSVLGLARDTPVKLLGDTFKKKGKEIIDQNTQVLDKAMDWAKGRDTGFEKLPEPPLEPGKRLMMQGNEAAALGAMAAGVKFCSFYPMTPSTSVPLNLIANAAAMGIVVEQAEDEIAAINMGLGASNAGARTIVPTSGGGFALMVEGVSLAGITEVPIVIFLAMRPGPATGLPTRTEQGDLNLALYAGHGEFPRAIFAPGAIEECFHLTYRAFDQAEKWQSPAIVLSDQFQADSYRDVEPFDLDGLYPTAQPAWEVDDPENYKRYAVTDNGVSPRAVPGLTEALVVVDSDEHYDDGHITEDHGVRIAQQDKRMRKKGGLLADVVAPSRHGNENPDTLFVCWGSALGAVGEAAAAINTNGGNAGVLHFSQVYPLRPDQFLDSLNAARETVMVEGNATGQFAALLRQETGFVFDKQVLRYDGLPFTAQYILERL